MDCGIQTCGTRRRSEERKRQKRKRRIFIIILFLLLLLLCLIAWFFLTTKSEAIAGTRIFYQGDMNATEAQAFIEEEMEKSRITVSLFPTPTLDQDTKSLDINFVVEEGNNGFSERFELEQNGRLIYHSAVIPPGHCLESIEVPDAEVGDATVTVYAVDKNGSDHGNPVSVEVTLQ